MADPFACNRRQEKVHRLSTKLDEFGDYDTTTSDQLHSPGSSLSSRISRSPIPGGSGGGGGLSSATRSSHRPCSRSPLPNGARSPRETPRLARQATNETELKQKIQALEGTVAEYERQKFNVMGTFAEYRERVAERERKLEAEYSAKIITLSEEVLAAKKDFEERMKQFQALQEKFEREKEGALEKLREEHQKEIQLLEQRCSEHQLLNLEQKYLYEIQRLDEERKSLKLEKEKLTEAFETKLWRAQTLYDTELNAAKSLYSNELDALKEHETALRDELMARQEEFKDRLEEMQLHLQQSKEELAKCEQEVVELEKRLEEKEMEVQVITKQLEEAKFETEEALNKLNGVENQLETTKQRNQEQEEQLLRKADLLSALEGTKNKLESVIQDLQSELKSLKGKVAFLENERQNLESQSQTQQQLQNSQLQALEMVLDNLSKEKQIMRDHYDQQLENERTSAEQRELSLKRDYTSKLHDFERHHKTFQQQLESKTAEQREATVKRLQTEYEHKYKSMEEENDRLRKQLQASLPTDAREIQNELDSLESKYKTACDDLGAEKEKSNSLRTELDSALEKLASLNSLVESQEKILDEKPGPCDFEKHHKEEIEKLKESVENSVRESMRTSLGKTLSKREEEYEEEIKSLRADLASHGLVDKSTTEEFEKTKAVVKNLQDTIDGLRVKLRQYEDNEGRRRGGTGSAKMDAENKFLRQELASTKAELAQCVDLHSQRVNELQKRLEEQKMDMLRKNEKGIRDEVERDLKQKCGQEAASVSSTATYETEKLQKKCKNLQKELEKKEKDYEIKLQQVTKENDQKGQLVDELNTQLKSLKSELDSTKASLEKKTKEILHIRDETHEYIRKREQQQSKTHKREVENLKNEHKTAIKSCEESKDKIAKEVEELREKLKRLEENRERTPMKEDVQKEMESLRQKLRDNEGAIKRLEEEKQAMKSSLGSGRDSHSQFSSPIGSMDSLRKRDSICSLGSAREGPTICRRAVNMAIVNKWHYLVEQVQREHRGSRTQKSSSTSSIHKQRHLTHGAMELGGASPEQKSPQQQQQQQQGQDSEHDLHEGTSDDRSHTTDEDSRHGRCSHRSTNTLRLPDTRRTTKSPSRSPQPKAKHLNAGKRPAWRL